MGVAMGRRLLSRNSVTGKATYWLQESDGSYAVYTEQDAAPTIDYAHALATEKKPGDTMRHIGEIPLVFLDQAIREGWFDDPHAWRRFLAAHSKFKVHKG
jgi:hypothetical protein